VKTFPHCIATFLLVLGLACSGGVDGPADDDGDRGPGDGDTADDDADSDDAENGDGDGMQSTEPCPAPALGTNEVAVYAEGDGSNWSSYGFGGSVTTETSNVCSGGSALKYAAAQYDGIGFGRTSPIAAVHLSVRVYVSEDSNWTIAALPATGANGHCYRLPFPTLCGQFDVACGTNQNATPCILQWETGWQTVELDIPASTGTVQQVMFENQTDPTGASITLIVDDLRLTQP
jgi:hypothetical protein